MDMITLALAKKYAKSLFSNAGGGLKVYKHTVTIHLDSGYPEDDPNYVTETDIVTFLSFSDKPMVQRSESHMEVAIYGSDMETIIASPKWYCTQENFMGWAYVYNPDYSFTPDNSGIVAYIVEDIDEYKQPQ